MKTKFHPRSERGSLLIVAMIFSAIVAICLTSYIRMARTAMTVSQRSFYANSAMNLTETGLEMAINAINNTSWGAWTTSGANATATFTGFTFGQGATGQVQVYVQNYNTTAPFLVAKGTLYVPNGAPIIKMVEVTGVVNRSLFAKGLVGKNGVSFTGNNPSVDAWNSNPTNAAAGTYIPVAYSSSNKVATGSVAAVNITADVSVQNADIFGTASVGANNTSNITVGPQGSIGQSFTTPAGYIDPNAVSGNFTANLPNVTNPTVPTGYTAISVGTITGKTTDSTNTFPRVGDLPASDGKYYYNVSSINPNGSNSFSVTGNVVFVMSGTISITGSQSINVASTGKLAIYTASNVNIAGNGIANSNTDPQSMQIYGTATSTGQSISVSGNGTLTAIVYAPNADVTAKGGGSSGSIYGAFVGNTISMAGNDAFHYDLNLGNMNGNPFFQPSKWVELVSAADRATYATQLP
ncbi:MAG TPA: hypothetical protein VF607_06260 [Verrucomicrobiae bacterium]